MCGRYVQTRAARYKARMLELAREAEAQRAESWNVAPTTLALAVRLGTPGRVADWLTWGLLGGGPDRAGANASPDTGYDNGEASPFRPINARVESVADKPFFREPWQARRCLVPADGWYEWSVAHGSHAATGSGGGSKSGSPSRGKSGRKQPYYFHRRDGQPIFLAALWTGDTYCLLTTVADGDLAQVHHRRPLTVRDEDAVAWLERAPASADQAIAAAIPPEAIAFHPVSPEVSHVRRDGPELLEPITLPPGPDLLPGF